MELWLLPDIRTKIKVLVIFYHHQDDGLLTEDIFFKLAYGQAKFSDSVNPLISPGKYYAIKFIDSYPEESTQIDLLIRQPL